MQNRWFESVKSCRIRILSLLVFRIRVGNTNTFEIRGVGAWSAPFNSTTNINF